MTEKMNSLNNKWQIGTEEWTTEIQANFQALKVTFVTDGGPVHHFPICRGSPGGGDFILHIDWSKWGMASMLYQDEGGDKSVFLGAIGWKTTSYEVNYHSPKGELAALNFTLQKFQHLLLKGEFLVRTDKTRVSNLISMKDPGGTVKRLVLNFSYFHFRIEHQACKEMADADHITRQTNLLAAT